MISFTPPARVLSVFVVVLYVASVSGQTTPAPTIDDVINLKRVGAPAMSPNG